MNSFIAVYSTCYNFCMDMVKNERWNRLESALASMLNVNKDISSFSANQVYYQPCKGYLQLTIKREVWDFKIMNIPSHLGRCNIGLMLHLSLATSKTEN